MTRASDSDKIETNIMYSILTRKPKRADIYWFIHLKRADEPYTMEYSVKEIVDDLVIRIDFNLGFRIQPKIKKLT